MAEMKKGIGYLATDSGLWIPAAYTGQISKKMPTHGTEFISALGRRTYFSRGVGPKSWQISGDMPISWAQNLQALAENPQRLYWASPLAQRSNLLVTTTPTYGASVGLRQMGETYANTYTLEPNRSYLLLAGTPVMPGTTIEATAYQAGGTFRMEFFNQLGIRVSFTKDTRATATLAPVKATATVPALATEVRLVAGSPVLFGGARLTAGGGSGLGSVGDAAFVTLHDLQVGHGKLAGKRTKVSVSYELVEVN